MSKQKETVIPSRTLRDEFAGLALSAIIAEAVMPPTEDEITAQCQFAYYYADAMLIARKHGYRIVEDQE